MVQCSWMLLAIAAAVYCLPIAQLPSVPAYDEETRAQVRKALAESRERVLAEVNVGELKESFRTKGFYIVRQAVPAEVLQLVKLHRPQSFLPKALFPLERLVLKTVDYLYDMDYSYGSLDCVWADDDLMMDFWDYSSVASLIHQCLPKQHANSKVRLLTDFYIGFPQGVTPPVIGGWHTDGQSFDIVDDSSVGLSAWIPLRNIEAHNGGGSLYFVSKQDTANVQEELSLCGVHSADPRETQDEKTARKCSKLFQFLDEKAQVEDWRMGDVLLFDKDFFHRSQPSLTGAERYSLIGRFITEKSRYKEIPKHVGTQRKNSCKHGLKDGQPMISPCFPQVFPKIDTKEQEVRGARSLGHDSIYTLAKHEISHLFF